MKAWEWGQDRNGVKDRMRSRMGVGARIKEQGGKDEEKDGGEISMGLRVGRQREKRQPNVEK